MQTDYGIGLGDRDVHDFRNHFFAGLQHDRPQILITSIRNTSPLYRHEAPTPTIAPLVMALVIGCMLVAGIYTPWGFVVGSLAIAYPFYLWAWPKKEEHQRTLEEEAERKPEGTA